MNMFSENLKYIFGLKIRDLRLSKNLSFTELADLTGLSVSYLNEIEKGKKYPKGDKILALAKAFAVEYDDLVSLKVNKRLQPLVDLLHSNLFQELPLEMYGLEVQKIIELISESPEKVTAFLSTVSQIARSYEMQREHFFFAAVRSYQEIHDNYFADIEDAAIKFKRENALGKDLPIKTALLENILKSAYNIKIDRETLPKHEILQNLRSLYVADKRTLMINKDLSSAQEIFLIGRELGFQYLNLRERPFETPPVNATSFDGLLNNFKASYFSVSFLMDKKEVIRDIRKFARLPEWEEKTFLNFLTKYDATPEMLMQRLTNILPQYFGIKNLFFLRFVGKDNFSDFELEKELHLSQVHNPHRNELGEHYCRRWLALRMIQRLRSIQSVEGKDNPIANVQVSHYLGTPNEYLCISVAYPNVSNPKEGVSIVIGFLIDENLQKMLKFLNAPSLKRYTVHTTCERCPLTDCNERVAPPEKVEAQSKRNSLELTLRSILGKK